MKFFKFNTKCSIQFLLLLLMQLINLSTAQRRTELVDSEGRYIVNWEVDVQGNSITFDVTVQTTGFVGFGLSPQGGMTGADIVIGGVLPDGTTYFSDRYATRNGMPSIDEQQDWTLDAGSENGTHTFLRFSRALDTCDPNNQDVAITTDTVRIIWSFGETDDIQYHGQNRGAYAVDLLDPPPPPVDLSNFSIWEVTNNIIMPSQPTTYWCSVHRRPPIVGKHHVVGFNVKNNNPDALRHSHHLVVWACTPPDGVDARTYFDDFTTNEGANCYTAETIRDNSVPLQNCREITYVWAIGGKPLVLPENVGYPIGLEEFEYVMLELHYDNPDVIENLRFESGVQIYYTPVLREFDAGVLMIDHDLTPAQMIPPGSPNFVNVAHCSSECTSKELPPEGINLINVLLHAHLAGRSLKLRHFRGNQELPWVASDENYAFDYQQNRPLRNEVKILPGDHLTYECTYETSTRTNVTLGGPSTQDEMCETFIWYYPKIGLSFCSSGYPETVDSYYSNFGIENITKGSSWAAIPPVVTAPASLANLTFPEVVNTMTDWTPEFRNDMQQRLRYGQHYSLCLGPQRDGRIDRDITPETPAVSYPTFERAFQPPESCEAVVPQATNTISPPISPIVTIATPPAETSNVITPTPTEVESNVVSPAESLPLPSPPLASNSVASPEIVPSVNLVNPLFPSNVGNENLTSWSWFSNLRTTYN